jgi:hypothetical protein
MLEWEQPMSESMEAAPHFSARLTLDGEGLTIPDGELAPGDYGEGFYDRRHPHTYVHELMLSGSDLLGRHDGELQLSLSAGKGFVAFGSDDPMSRPVVRYPVDHHLAQILERGVLIGRASYGPMAVEVTGFDGDEPTKPSDWPNWDRGLDSRAVRVTAIVKSFAVVAGRELTVRDGQSFAVERQPSAEVGRGLHRLGHRLLPLQHQRRLDQGELTDRLVPRHVPGAGHQWDGLGVDGRLRDQAARRQGGKEQHDQEGRTGRRRHPAPTTRRHTCRLAVLPSCCHVVNAARR